LHKWIDAPSKESGIDHRTKRHAYNRKDEKFIRDYWEKKKPGWGDKAVCEWLFHIAIDNLWTAFKKAIYVYGEDGAFNFFKFAMNPYSKYIFYDFRRYDDKNIEKEFKDIYGFEDEDDHG